MARTRVVLDANALMLPFQFRVNLDAELTRLLGTYDAFVPSSVLGELRRLAARDRAAKAALALAAKYRTHETEERGDRAIVAVATHLGAHVVTSDRGLLAALRELRIPRITLRSKTHLVLLE